MKVRIWAVLIAVCMIMSAAMAADFEGHWSAEYITKARENGWMMGDSDGNFRPNDSITRAEFAVMLWRALGNPAAKEDLPFSDVTAEAFYLDAATALYEMEIISGYGEGLFGPNDTLTREMGCTMLVRAFGLEASDAAVYKAFGDWTDVSAWAADAISAMLEMEYISGIGGNLFAPKGALTRGEMAKLLASFFEEEGKPETEEPKTPETPEIPGENDDKKETEDVEFETNIGMVSKKTDAWPDDSAVYNVRYFNKDTTNVQSQYTMDRGEQFDELSEGDVVIPSYDYDGMVKGYAYVAAFDGTNLVYGAGAKPFGNIKYTIGRLLEYNNGSYVLADSDDKTEYFDIDKNLNIPVYNGSKAECITAAALGGRIKKDGTPKNADYSEVLMLVVTVKGEVTDVFAYFI